MLLTKEQLAAELRAYVASLQPTIASNNNQVIVTDPVTQTSLSVNASVGRVASARSVRSK